MCARREAAPALFRLLADSALPRAALYACGVPLALVEADAAGCTFSYASAAFESWLGSRWGEVRGSGVGTVM